MKEEFALTPLPRSFYRRAAVTVAKDLLGKIIFHHTRQGIVAGRIVEVEAYTMNDPASHSFRGRTQRNDVMFWDGGYLYVYFTYGMHFCANVVTGEPEVGEAVLIRAVEPLLGIERMMYQRFGKEETLSRSNLIQLTNGPAKFCEAFGITKKENGTDLLGQKLWLSDDGFRPASIRKSSRIGIRVGKEKLWRFSIEGNLWVSR